MKKLALKLIMAAVVLSVTTIRGNQAEEALNKMRTAWKSVNRYTVTITSHQEKGSKTQDITTNVSYKRPGWVKVHVTQGDNKGSVAVYNPHKNNVRVKWGGIGLPVAFSADAKMVTGLRGDKIYSMTFGHMLKHADWYLANGTLSWVCDATVDGAACAVIEFTTHSPDKNLGIARERWWLDKKTGFIRKTNGFDASGKKVQWSTFRSLKLNPDLAEDHFKL
jgi:outer membrane lipoprotein-sorting protein